jgi:predicted ester cyclase
VAAGDNKAALRHAMECFSDPACRTAYFDLYTDETVLHGYPGVEPGLESIKQFYAAFWAAFPDARLTASDMLGEGDSLACRFRIDATHRGEFLGVPSTGRPISFEGITILRFAGGRCVERWSQADFLGVLQQIGALPAR